jgi:hypothetical protein
VSAAYLPALVDNDGQTWWVWCPHCRRKHMHGGEVGHRVAHCFRKDSPYEHGGYIGWSSAARTIDELEWMTLTILAEDEQEDTPGTQPQVPVRTAVYKTYDAEWVPLYFGISNDFGRRWQQEAREKSWWPEVAHQTVDWYDDEPTARAAEREAIRAENPRHNIVHRKAGAA